MLSFYLVDLRFTKVTSLPSFTKGNSRKRPVARSVRTSQAERLISDYAFIGHNFDLVLFVIFLLNVIYFSIACSRLILMADSC